MASRRNLYALDYYLNTFCHGVNFKIFNFFLRLRVFNMILKINEHLNY